MLGSTFNQTGTKELLFNNKHHNDLMNDGLDNNSSNTTDVLLGVTLFFNQDGIHNATQWLAVCLLIEAALTTGEALQ